MPNRDLQTHRRARDEAHKLLTKVRGKIPGLDANLWADRIADELCGLGPLRALMDDAEVYEVFIQGPERLLVRRPNSLAESEDQFSSAAAIELLVRRMAGLKFDASHPMIDAHTPEGFTVHAVHGSVAAAGPVVAVSRPAGDEGWSLEELARRGEMSQGMAGLLKRCVEANFNILVCGGPGARTFPLAAALANASPEHERQVLVRPGRGPGLRSSGAVVLEGGALGGTVEATPMEALVRSALLLDPERLVVLEVGGPEAATVFAALGRGLSGAIITTRASTAAQGVARMRTLICLGQPGVDVGSVGQHIAQTLELIVCVDRFPDGRCRVTQLAEATIGPDGYPAAVEFMSMGPGSRQWNYNGHEPEFFAELARRNLAVDLSKLGD